MERKEEIWRLFSLVTFPSEGKETRLDLRRWPTFASKENSSEWTNSRKGIDLFISSRWIEFLIATAMFLSLSLSLLPLQHLKWSKHSLNGLPVAFARKIFHHRYAPLSCSNLSLSYYLEFPYLSFLCLRPLLHPVSISRNKKYLVESDNAELRFLESRAEFLISAAIHDNNNAL